MTRKAATLPKVFSLKSNTHAGDEEPNDGSKLYMAARVEKCDVLRIVTPYFILGFREHALGTKAMFPPGGVTSVTF